MIRRRRSRMQSRTRPPLGGSCRVTSARWPASARCARRRRGRTPLRSPSTAAPRSQVGSPTMLHSLWHCFVWLCVPPRTQMQVRVSGTASVTGQVALPLGQSCRKRPLPPPPVLRLLLLLILACCGPWIDTPLPATLRRPVLEGAALGTAGGDGIPPAAAPVPAVLRLTPSPRQRAPRRRGNAMRRRTQRRTLSLHCKRGIQ